MTLGLPVYVRSCSWPLDPDPRSIASTRMEINEKIERLDANKETAVPS